MENPMVRMQIVERPGARLFSLLKRAIRSKELRTFSLEKHGTRVVHIRSPGHMNWTDAAGVIACEIKSPRDEGKEWQFLANIVGPSSSPPRRPLQRGRKGVDKPGSCPRALPLQA